MNENNMYFEIQECCNQTFGECKCNAPLSECQRCSQRFAKCKCGPPPLACMHCFKTSDACCCDYSIRDLVNYINGGNSP